MNASVAAMTPAPTMGDLKTAAQNMRVMLVFITAGFATTFMLCVGLVLHLRHRRRFALKGDAASAQKIVLPAYEPLLSLLAFVNGAFVVFLVITLNLGLFSPKLPPLVLESCYSGNQFVFVVVLVVLMQKNLSFRALTRSVLMSIILSTYTIPYLWYATTYPGDVQRRRQLLIVHLSLRGFKYLLFVYAFIRPPNRASKRTIREYCTFALTHYALTVAHMLLLVNQSTIPKARYVMYTNLSWVALTPLVVWRVLRADTDYWRGLGEQAGALQQLFQRQHAIQERVSARGLHILLEMHRKDVIDFAFLDLESQIGVGSTSNVYRGTLKAKTLVAVKVYMPDRVTEGVLAAFSHEAAMCAALRHPNIVSFLGLCVAPPTVCLVFELCQGNLDDVMCEHARRKYHPVRQQMLINVGYMLDAARAVSYLHSFTPPCLHRDIQPANFLVDAECNVKLADFGESRGLAVINYRASTSSRSKSMNSSGYEKTPKSEDVCLTIEQDGTDAGVCNCESGIERLWHPTGRNKGPLAYVAPEVVVGREDDSRYGEAADVYALGVTMWDILYPFARQFRDFESNETGTEGTLGSRSTPSGAERLYASPEYHIPTALIEIINGALHRDPQRRLNALSIVAGLEALEHELSVEVASRVMFDLEQFDDPMGVDESPTSGDRHNRGIGGVPAHIHRFTGILAVDRMVDRNYVSLPVEGIRMGNAFMNAGLLHHVTHSRHFENSTELYFFDNSAALYRNSISSHGAEFDERGSLNNLTRSSKSTSGTPDRFVDVGIPMLSSFHALRSRSRSAALTSRGTQCSCRKLAQRLVQTVNPVAAAPRARFGLDSFRKPKRATVAPRTPILLDAGVELEMELEHAFGEMDDSAELGSGKLAPSA